MRRIWHFLAGHDFMLTTASNMVLTEVCLCGKQRQWVM